MDKIKYKRIILKLSGEYLIGKDYWINKDRLIDVVLQIKDIINLGIEVCIVVGGGNILRGRDNRLGFDKVSEDYMGMLATVINSLALKEAFNSIGLKSKIQSSFSIEGLIKRYDREDSIKYLEEGNIIIFAGGTGNPFFTTDTASVLRGLEMKCDIILKATNVEGVYDDDPHQNKNASKFSKISFDEAISRNLKVMDSAAFALCREGRLNIIVFSLSKKDSLKKLILGEEEGTLVFYK